MNSLNNKNRKKTVLITGAGQGIGQAIAFRFAADGSNIVTASKDSSAQIQETVEGIQSAGGEALCLEVDVRNCDELKKSVAAAVSRFGGRYLSQQHQRTLFQRGSSYVT